MRPAPFAPFPPAVLAILALGAAPLGRGAGRPDPARHFLHLRNGSLVESIVFRSAWLKAHPDEDAIIVVRESARSGRLSDSAVSAYTQRGAVLVHDPDRGTVALASLVPADLGRPDRVAAEWSRFSGASPSRPEAGAGDFAAQIARAYAALHDHDAMGYFPAAVSPLPSVVRAAGGRSVRKEVSWLVFDWNDGHYGYRPDVGVVRQPVPTDPATGCPSLCLGLGDLVESVIFCAEYRRGHPGESAVLLFRPHDRTRAENTGGMAAAAYTRRGQLHIHSVYFGDISLAENGRPLAARAIREPRRLGRAYDKYLWGRFVSAYRAAHGHPPDPRALRRGGRDFAELLGTAAPQHLLGDTPELQVRRAYQRAQALGLSSEVSVQPGIGPSRAPKPCLVLCWNVSEYVYQPAIGAHYAMETDATVLPNRLIDGILFAPAYRREHPGEKAVAIPYRDAGGGKWKAVTAYTRNGQVWLHNPETGESRLSACAPSDLENPARFKRVRIDGNRLIKAEAVRSLRLKAAALDRLPLDRDADDAALEPGAVYARLRAAGIPCRLLPATLERDPAGIFRPVPSPSVAFRWWGVTYTYGPGHYCTASDGFIARP